MQVDDNAWVPLRYDRDQVPYWAWADEFPAIVAVHDPSPEELAALMPGVIPPDVALRLCKSILAARPT